MKAAGAESKEAGSEYVVAMKVLQLSEKKEGTVLEPESTGRSLERSGELSAEATSLERSGELSAEATSPENEVTAVEEATALDNGATAAAEATAPENGATAAVEATARGGAERAEAAEGSRVRMEARKATRESEADSLPPWRQRVGHRRESQILLLPPRWR